MVSDSIINASIPNASKDFGKKKRPNRSAKLKQCKLDARREQWLSQVKNKSCKEEVNASPVVVSPGAGKFNGPTIETRKKAPQCCKDLQVQSPSVEEINHHDSDSESSPSNSPTSSISRGNDSVNTYTGSSSSSSSSFGSGGCCSGSMTEEEEGEGGDGGCGDDDCLDDWEAVADALVGATDDNQGHNPNPCLSPNQETASDLNFGAQSPSCDNVDVDNFKSDGVGILGNVTENCRAWRPDDAFRPQSLPNLAKQRSFPSGAQRHHEFTANPWVRNNTTPRVPTSCPICCEDLDLTDSSFLPCPCGFHLCLFCHKRILEEDGRCPGCRNMYASDLLEKEANVSGGSLTIRLARSCSMSCSRV